MIYAPRFTLRAFEELSEPGRLGAIRHLVEALIRINEAWLSEHQAPWLYESGVKYQAERLSDDWQDIPQTLARRFGDCEDLGAWRAAELRHAGEREAGAWVKTMRVGMHVIYHVQVRRSDGRIEDPSQILGMGSRT